MISVIVPIYNNEKYLAKCIDSILVQEYRDFELILIDDGSRDGSGSICDQYAIQDERIVVIHQKNKGVSVARNKGLSIARGNYVTFIDSDDWVMPEYLSVLNKNMTPEGLSTCNVSDKNSFCGMERMEYMNKAQAQVSVFSYSGIQGFPFCKLYDRKVIEDNQIRFAEDIALCEDLLFNIQYISVTTGKICRDNRQLYYYYNNPSGALHNRFSTSTPMKSQFLTEIHALNQCEQYLITDEQVWKSYTLRKTKAAVVTLRVMCAKEYDDMEQYKKLVKFIRKNVLAYLLGDTGAKSSKISVFLSAISPKIEYRVWKKYMR